MKYIKLEQLIKEEAHNLKENAGYAGSWNDGGSANLLARLNEFKQKFVVKYDLRPSEYYKLNDIDVGEPEEFITEINRYKLKLSKEIVKNMKL